MKKIWTVAIISLILFFSMTFQAISQETIIVNPKGLIWQKTTTNTDGSQLTNLEGYIIHWGLISGDYSNSLNIPVSDLTDPENPNFDIDYATAENGIYYYVVSAYNNLGTESLDYSNEVFFKINQLTPSNCENLQTTGGVIINININTGP